MASKDKWDLYEDVVEEITSYFPENYNELTREEKEPILNKALAKIREINKFPVYAYTEKGIDKEIQSCIDFEICFIDNKLSTFSSRGLNLLDTLFPNLHKAYAGGSEYNAWSRFYNDEKLKECIDGYFRYHPVLKSVRTLFLINSRFFWRTATNFSPMRAKAIFEKFCPENGVIYDYCSGYGGRMLGALSSKKNFTYYGTDPNSETYENLLTLGGHIERVTKRENSFKVKKRGSEIFDEELDNKIDFAFSCPPFFNLETYSFEDTQSIVKFPKYEDWLEGYVRPTVQNCYKYIKEDGIYGVDVMNFLMYGKYYTLIEDWIRIAEEEGFILRGVYPIETKTKKVREEDKENVYIFTKNNDVVIDYTDKVVLAQYKKRIEDIERRKNGLKNKVIAEYDINGDLVNTYASFDEITEYPDEDIENYAKKKKRCHAKHYRVYKYGGEEQHIDVKPVFLEVEGEYFDSYADAARFLETSRQHVQQSHRRRSKKIMGHKVTWIDN